MNTLKTKIMLLLLVLGALTVMPLQLRADGNPGPVCGNQVCIPSN